MNQTQKKLVLKLLSIIFLLGSVSWLLAPHLNHFLRRGPNMASEYEAMNMPYAYVFRFFDVTAALALMYGIYIKRTSIKRGYGALIMWVLYIWVIIASADALLPVTCEVTRGVCRATNSLASSMHGIESLLLGTVIFLASTYLAVRRFRFIWMPFVQIISVTGMYLSYRFYDGWTFSFQLIYLFSQLLWIYYIVFQKAWSDKISPKTSKRIRQITALFVASNGISSLLVSAHIYRVGRRLDSLLFINDTAWFVQHSVLIGISMLLLSRYILKGSEVARRTVLVISVVEVIKYSVLTPRPMALIGYILLTLVLLFGEQLFSRKHASTRFLDRVRATMYGIVMVFAALTIFSVGFSAFNKKAWQNSAFSTGRVMSRLLLLEVRTNPSDTLRAKLYSQTLTAAGIFLYTWLFIGLFLPALLPHKDTDQEDKLVFKKLLEVHGSSSEDSLKLWPEDKKYWLNREKTTGVAYKQSGRYAYALADPIGPKNVQLKVLREFKDYCHNHGTFACWLLVTHTNIGRYKNAGYNTIAIGSSAVVNIADFSTTTVKSKWWRWARNKATKQGLHYVQLAPPHSSGVLQQLQTVSYSWLGSGGHSERTFALGYYDTDFISQCVVHTLQDEAGTIVAFANQLPTYGVTTCATIDLMRFIPTVDAAMALLLSETILNLGQNFDSFDLGFVPLAQLGKKKTVKAVFNLSKKALKPVFSMQGLEQFKNKFEPTWHTNYLAWDGDVLDIPAVTTSLQKALTLPKK